LVHALLGPGQGPRKIFGPKIAGKKYLSVGGALANHVAAPASRPVLVDLRNIILATFQIFAFSHRLGLSQTFWGFASSANRTVRNHRSFWTVGSGKRGGNRASSSVDHGRLYRQDQEPRQQNQSLDRGGLAEGSERRPAERSEKIIEAGVEARERAKK
jgi:hypothetical protein